MCFSSVNRSCFKLFLFLTVSLNITLLKMGFVVVQWENENSVSVVHEKKKGQLTNSNNDRVAIYKARILKVCGEYKLRYSLRDQNLTKE